MNRRIVYGVAVALFAGAVSAAPVPKDAGKGDPTPDLKAFSVLVEKAVKAQKWPEEADEKTLRATAEVVFNRALKAADQKGRDLPVDFPKLTKADVEQNYKKTSVDGAFIVAEDVRITGAKNCVIFASGDVQITGATNCVIVAKNVRCTVVDNCVVVASEYVQLNSADGRKNAGDRSVLVAGSWIRTTSMEGTICHVLRPTGLPPPDEAKLAGNRPHPAVRTNRADGVVFLNAQEDTGANGPKNCTYLPQKTPLAK